MAISNATYTAVAYEEDNHDVLYQESGLFIDLNDDGELDDDENFVDSEIITIDNRDYILELNYP